MSEIILNNSATPDNPSNGKVKIYSGTDSVIRVLNSSGSITPITKSILIVNETQVANTAGGTFTSGADRTRTLNTVISNTISGASLVSNQITLPLGTYYIYAKCPAHQVDRHQAKIYSITNTVDLLIGSSEFSANAGSYTASNSFIIGILTLTTTTIIEIRHRCQTSNATRGFGVESNLGNNEIYTQFIAEKIA